MVVSIRDLSSMLRGIRNGVSPFPPNLTTGPLCLPPSSITSSTFSATAAGGEIMMRMMSESRGMEKKEGQIDGMRAFMLSPSFPLDPHHHRHPPPPVSSSPPHEPLSSYTMGSLGGQQQQQQATLSPNLNAQPSPPLHHHHLLLNPDFIPSSSTFSSSSSSPTYRSWRSAVSSTSSFARGGGNNPNPQATITQAFPPAPPSPPHASFFPEGDSGATPILHEALNFFEVSK